LNLPAAEGGSLAWRWARL